MSHIPGQVTDRRMVRMPSSDDDRTLFGLPDPINEHEERFQLWVSTPAWQSQGCPEEILITLMVVQGE